MKQLVYSSNGSVIVGLNNVVLLAGNCSTNVVTLQPPDNNDEEASPIQAVAVSTIGELTYGAVARQDKSLSIYQISDSHTLQPVATYKTDKRVGSLQFGTVPPEHLPIVVVGDFTGGATAFSVRPTTSKSETNSRVLLGHTASSLSSLCLTNNNHNPLLLTADRDEKIRVSEFPNTHLIHGYLLGHTEYVSCIDCVSCANKQNGELCASVGGDKTLRVWNIRDCTQLAQVQVAEHTDNAIPTKVVWSCRTLPYYLVVLCDDSTSLKLYRYDGKETLKQCCHVECPSQPLGLCTVQSSTSDDLIFVLCREPSYLVPYQIQDESLSLVSDHSLCQTLNQPALDNKIVLANRLLEQDEHGNLKFAKTIEERGGAVTRPWNNIPQRKELHAKSRSAAKRRRRHKRQAQQEEEKVNRDGSAS